jgi:hypothetical protein
MVYEAVRGRSDPDHTFGGHNSSRLTRWMDTRNLRWLAHGQKARDTGDRLPSATYCSRPRNQLRTDVLDSGRRPG